MPGISRTAIIANRLSEIMGPRSRRRGMGAEMGLAKGVLDAPVGPGRSLNDATRVPTVPKTFRPSAVIRQGEAPRRI